MAATARHSVRAVARPMLQLVGDSDGELVRRVADGDHDAFESLYRRYARPVLGLALRRLGDRARAEDAVQEAFTAIWRSASTYRPERGAGASWLFAVARHAIVDTIRASARERYEPAERAPEPVSQEPGPAESTEDDWLAFCVHAAVDELPERERVPLELAYWHGRSQSEIAQLLGVPLGTVKTRTRSGLARLAARLEGAL